MGKGSRNPRNRWKQVVLAERRGLRRMARREHIYRPDRWATSHKPKKNPKFKIKGKSRGTKRIAFPSKLSFDSVEGTKVALALLREIRDAALHGHYKKIVLDHAEVQEVSPEVALALVAEIQRCEVYCGTRTNITGTYPKVAQVSELLSELGFFEALEIKEPVLPKTYTSRTYVRVERGNRISAELVASLLDCFSQEVTFAEQDRKRLHVALLECMDNVFEHAYDVAASDPYLYKEWWLAGYADHEDRSIGFLFYDQGAGIPETIRKRTARRVLERLRHWSDAQWIERAVRKSVSRHASLRRGHGLEKLKKFLDELGEPGSLRVLANRGDVEFRSMEQEVMADYLEEELHGTFIIWKLKNGGSESKALPAEHADG